MSRRSWARRGAAGGDVSEAHARTRWRHFYFCPRSPTCVSKVSRSFWMHRSAFGLGGVLDLLNQMNQSRLLVHQPHLHSDATPRQRQHSLRPHPDVTSIADTPHLSLTNGTAYIYIVQISAATATNVSCMHTYICINHRGKRSSQTIVQHL